MKRFYLKLDYGLLSKLLFFIIWPFGAWLHSLSEPQKKSSYLIFFLFSLLWHMAPTGLTSDYTDFLGILARFKETSVSTRELLQEIDAFFHFSSDAPKELYEDFLIWITKSFTDNYHVFFLLAAIPVAVFQLKCVHLITSDDVFYPCLWGGIAVIMMIIPRDIIAVQNPRFTTGFWMFCFCSLYGFSAKRIKVKYLLPLLLLPAIHSGMWLALIMAFGYLFIPKRITGSLEVLAYLSIPFIFIDSHLSSLLNVSLFPENISQWAERYNSEEYYDKYVIHVGRSGFWWVDELFTVGSKIVYLSLAIMVIKKKKTYIGNNAEFYFYPYFLYTFIIINLIQFIPVLGARYLGFWKIFIFFTWFKFFHFSRKTPYLLLLAVSLWPMFKRYGYVLGGSLSVNMPPDIFIAPLPYLIGEGVWY